jgi:adenylate kinase family enzyme
VIRDRIGVYERQTEPILKYYMEKKVPFVDFKTEDIDMPPEVAVEEILKQLKKLKVA